MQRDCGLMYGYNKMHYRLAREHESRYEATTENPRIRPADANQMRAKSKNYGMVVLTVLLDFFMKLVEYQGKKILNPRSFNL